MVMKQALALMLMSCALTACGPVQAEDVKLSSPPAEPCAKVDGRALADFLGATFQESPEEAAEHAAASGSLGRLPRSGWVPYERQEESVWLAAEDWRLKAAREPDRGWVVVEAHRCE